MNPWKDYSALNDALKRGKIKHSYYYFFLIYFYFLINLINYKVNYHRVFSLKFLAINVHKVYKWAKRRNLGDLFPYFNNIYIKKIVVKLIQFNERKKLLFSEKSK